MLSRRIDVSALDRVDLFIVIAGYIKNVCNGSFGSVKGLFRARDVYVSGKHDESHCKSATTTECVLSVQVRWLRWRSLLQKFFRIPSGLQISKQHVFSFRKETLEQRKEESKSEFPNLAEVFSKHDKNRRGYVTKFILKKYFKDDNALKEKYISNGVQ
eukprot:IDg11482t1